MGKKQETRKFQYPYKYWKLNKMGDQQKLLILNSKTELLFYIRIMF